MVLDNLFSFLNRPSVIYSDNRPQGSDSRPQGAANITDDLSRCIIRDNAQKPCRDPASVGANRVPQGKHQYLLLNLQTSLYGCILNCIYRASWLKTNLIHHFILQVLLLQGLEKCLVRHFVMVTVQHLVLSNMNSEGLSQAKELFQTAFLRAAHTLEEITPARAKQVKLKGSTWAKLGHQSHIQETNYLQPWMAAMGTGRLLNARKSLSLDQEWFTHYKDTPSNMAILYRVILSVTLTSSGDDRTVCEVVAAG